MGHRVHRDGARVGGEGYLPSRQGALVERHLSPMSPLGTLVSVVSVVSVLKKSTREKWSRVGTLLEPCLGDRYARVALGV